MDDRPPDGMLHWGSAMLAAIVVLALAVPVLTAAAPWSRAKKPAPYSFTNSLKGKAIISAKGVRPGQSGTSRVVIANGGKKPFKTVKLTQSKSTNPFGKSLDLQVFDTTTKRCLYPLPKLKKPKKGKPAPKPPKTCTAWAAWTGGAKLRNVVVAPRKGATWTPKEKHTIQLKWRIGTDVPQGMSATFRLDWRASA